MGDAENPFPQEVGTMKGKLYWLAFKKDDEYWLSPYRAESRQDALRHGMEHVLDRELVAVFSEDTDLSPQQMLDLASVMPRPGSVFRRAE